MTERGTTLLETLIIGFAIVILVAHAVVALGRLQAAGAAATEAAQHAATLAARHGSPRTAHDIASTMLPGAHIETDLIDDRMTVIVSIDVSLVGPANGPLTRTVHGRATVAVSPYRSGR